MQQQTIETEVLGVVMAKVDEKRLRAYAKSVSIKVGAKDDAAQVVRAVTEVNSPAAQKKPEIYLQCDCGGISEKTLVECPFCGYAEQEDHPEEMVEEASSSDEELDGKEETALRDRLAAPKPKANGLAKVNGNGAATVVHNTTPRQDLKRILGQVHGLVKDWTNNAWDIGDQLVLLSAESPERPALWRLVKDADGVKQKYKGFSAFVRAEVGISEEMAKSCLHVASEYTRDQLPGFSISKLSIVLNAPESQQRKILGKVGTKTAAQIREVVKEANIKEGKKLKAKGEKDPREKRTAARQARAKTERAAKDASKGVTTFVMPGHKATVKLFKKAKDAEGELIPASSATDAWGYLAGKNGVQLVFRLDKTAEGRLKIHFEAKREE
jgi:hypothetical protein